MNFLAFFRDVVIRGCCTKGVPYLLPGAHYIHCRPEKNTGGCIPK
jgi:hypothetical protein